MHTSETSGTHLEQVAVVSDRLLAPVAVVAADSRLLYANPTAAHAIGTEPAQLLGRRMLDLVHPSDRSRLAKELADVANRELAGGTTTFRIRADASREWRTFEAIADDLLDDPRFRGILLSCRDVTDRERQQRELYDAAHRDSLTGLPNRTQIQDDLRARMRSASGTVVAFIGLDRFKLINESLGHAAGDDVLRAVALRLRAAMPNAAVVGRFASDVFVVLVDGLTSEDAHALIWRAVERVSEPLFLAGRELRLSASAGVARLDASATADSLLGDASLALHRAKAGGGDRCTVFASSMRVDAVNRLELEADLRIAIREGQLALALQPIVRLDDGTAVRSEALIRWFRADGTPVAPCTFIPIAEETGLVVPLGEWTIEQGARLARRAPGGSVAINLSPRQLAAPRLAQHIRATLAARAIPASSLSFEITETLLMEQFDYAVGVIRTIRDLGCSVGLDDFGTGYSSLAYLRRLPIDFLKIDGSLTTEIDVDQQARTIVHAILRMADALGVEVVAEGVESEAQARVLQEIGCVFAQGYHLGRPVVTHVSPPASQPQP
jgi:diguanylate cyclase (GGDEF)-like protein/PAS domain S-box-containing protein